MHTKTPSVSIQGNITAIRCRNDVIRSVLFRHISTNLGMMVARDFTSCQAARSTLVLLVANNVQKSVFKCYRPFVGPIETQGSANSRVLFIRCVRPVHNSIVIDTFYQ